MSKAIIVVDFAYKGAQRKGHGTGRKGLSSTLKYLQYRDKVQNQLAANRDYERWQDRGMGIHWRELEVQRERGQAPTLVLRGRSREIGEARGGRRMLLTLTHDGVYALAQAMLVDDAPPAAVIGAARDAAAGAR